MTYYKSATPPGNPFTEHAAVLLRRRHGDQRITTGCGPQLYECADYTAAYARVADKVHSTFPVCEIDRICQVNAPQMYGMYLLRKEEMELQCSGRPYGTEVRELELYHVTTESKGNASLRSGLDWRRTTRSKYGRGVSFSDDADYADYYANNTSSEDNKRVIIVCAVLVAKTWRVNNKNKNKNKNNRRLPNNKELIVPPGTCDTTVSPNGRVYVKYYDYEFYPLYMVYYRRRPEHVPLSRYHNVGDSSNSNKKKLAHQQQCASADAETRRREREELERRQKEEQLRWHQEMVRKQRERRLREQLEEQERLWQSQRAERLRREQLELSERQRWRRQQQSYGDGGGGGGRRSDGNARNKESCSIL